MKNTRTLTFIAGILDTLLGVTFCVLAVIFYFKATAPQPDNITGMDGLGYGIAMAILLIFSILCGIVGLIITIYGIIILLLSRKSKSGKITSKRVALIILSIIEIIFAIIIVFTALLESASIIPAILVALLLIATAVLKFVDCNKMKNEKKLQQSLPSTDTQEQTIQTTTNNTNLN